MRNPKHKGRRRKWAKRGGKVIVVIGDAVKAEFSSRVEAWAFIESAGQGVAYVECNMPWIAK